MFGDEFNKYVETFKPSSPEQLLIFNILIRTYTDLTGDANDVTPIVRKQATRWVLSKNQDWFGFYWCCEHTPEKDFCKLIKSIAAKLKIQS